MTSQKEMAASVSRNVDLAAIRHVCASPEAHLNRRAY
jgi:hypothetical protein